MSKAEILAGLKKLSRAELAEVQAGLDALLGDDWIENGELSAADKAALDSALTDYRAHSDAGSSWETVASRVRAQLKA
ncbi:MAG: hypothetical protein QM691_13785 [Opitutaceae bacterium]